MQREIDQNALHGFWPKSDNLDFGKKSISSERASQEQKIDANFSSMAPFGQELLVQREIDEVSWNRRFLRNRATESHEIWWDCST